MSKICYIAAASIAVATVYNKNPDADFIVIMNEHMDAIVEYFKDHVVYQYCADLTMDGQLKFKGKPVMFIDKTIYRSRPSDKRIPKEERCYDLLERLGVPFERIDHEAVATVEGCDEIGKLLGIAGEHRGYFAESHTHYN